MNSWSAARELLEQGLSIIPVNRDKRPLPASWTPFTERAPCAEQVDAWEKAYPDAGVAIVCGLVSGVVVVDIERDALELFPVDEMPSSTPRARTQGGGLHFYFACTEVTRTRNLARSGKHIGEIRAERAIVVAPPSKGERGQYEWEVPFDRESLQPMPEWVSSFVSSIGAAPRERVARGGTRSEQDLSDAIRMIMEGRNLLYVCVELFRRNSAQDRKAHACEYVKRTMRRAMEYIDVNTRDVTFIGVRRRAGSLVLTFDVLDAGQFPKRCTLTLDYPRTVRSAQRWGALEHAVGRPIQLEADLRVLRRSTLRVEFIARENRYVTGRVFRRLSAPDVWVPTESRSPCADVLP